jgi:glycerol uptake facilitator protein
MEKYVAEFVGTALLVLFGDGVVATVLLARSKGQNSGWIVITTGWALAVAVAVYAVGNISGAHINPAVTLGFALIGFGGFGWDQVIPYWIAQLLGGFVGGILVYLVYLPHWAPTENADLKLAVFSTGPAVRDLPKNLLTEIIGTFVLVLGVLAIVANKAPGQSGLTPLLIGFLVWGIGLSLGGPTGYAINPARDLGPRLAHFALPIPGKRDPDWQYAWIPVVGPLIGGALGAIVYQVLFANYLLKVVS